MTELVEQYLSHVMFQRRSRIRYSRTYAAKTRRGTSERSISKMLWCFSVFTGGRLEASDKSQHVCKPNRPNLGSDQLQVRTRVYELSLHC